jgi:diacylglycerol kinase (ATP)
VNIGVVMNPRAGGGRMNAEWPGLARAIKERLGAFQLAATTRGGEAPALAQGLAESGVDLVIAIGGDGTIGEVADGLLRASRRPQLGIVPIGTGVDFPRNLRLGPTPLDAVEVIASGRTRIIDAGRITYVADDGSPGIKHFINEASAGLSGPTVRAVNAAKARGRSGRFTFLYHTLAQLIGYRWDTVRVTLDGTETIESRIAVVAMCNGRYFGSALMVAPEAELDDGLLDVVIVKAASKLALVRVLNAAYAGEHRKSPLCVFRRAKSIEIEPVGRAALIDIDGESPGRLPVRVDVLPGALTLRA